jgi:hypothetical protein
MKNSTEIKGKYLSSMPVYLVNWNISFRYDSENKRLIIYHPRDMIERMLESFGFDLNDFQIRQIK